MFDFKAFILEPEISLAIINQLLPIKLAICVVLLQGAADISNIISHSLGFNTIAGIILEVS
jgi:hypothetical protein